MIKLPRSPLFPLVSSMELMESISFSPVRHSSCLYGAIRMSECYPWCNAPVWHIKPNFSVLPDKFVRRSHFLWVLCSKVRLQQIVRS